MAQVVIDLDTRDHLPQQYADKSGGVVMASVTPVFEGERMSVGRVFQRAMSAISLNPIVVLGLALLIGAIPGLMMTYLMLGAVQTDPQNASPSSLMGAALLSVVFGLIVSA